MNLLVSKIISLSCTLVLTLFFGLFPCVVVRRYGSGAPSSRRDKIIKLCNCFAGGVFLGALFLDMLPEGSEEFDNYKTLVGYKSEYPFFAILVILGFFLTSSVEYFAHQLLHDSHAHRRELQVVDCGPETKSIHDGTHASGVQKSYGTMEDAERSIMTYPGPSGLHRPGESVSNVYEYVTNAEEADASVPAVTYNEPAHTSSKLRSILLLLALSFHSIFDGLALGLQRSPSNVWEIFIAVAIHKCIVAFCLGLEVFLNNATKMAIAEMVIFAVISPIGSSIGIVLTNTGIDEVAQSLTSSILQGVACGAFLYITFLEILAVSWKDGSQRSFLDIIFAMAGFVVLAIAAIWD